MSPATKSKPTRRSRTEAADPGRPRKSRMWRSIGRGRRTEIPDRFPRRIRETPRRWPWILALALVGVFLCGAVFAVFFSPLLGVKAVTIIGAPDALTAKIRTVVDIPDGIPLARVDLDGVATEVVALPEVSDVDVSRGWPDTLAISVNPRVPVAVTSANGQFWLLDAAGYPYLAVAAPPAGLVTVQLVTPGEGDPSTVAALTVAAALTPELRARVAEISARTVFDVELTLTDGTRITWGAATQSAEKMQILPALLAAQQGTLYDITDPTLVSVR